MRTSGMRQFFNTIMATGALSGETAIYVSTSSKLNIEQTRNITDELLRIIGYPSNYNGFKIHFVAEGEGVQANAYVDSELRVSFGN